MRETAGGEEEDPLVQALKRAAYRLAQQLYPGQRAERLGDAVNEDGHDRRELGGSEESSSGWTNPWATRIRSETARSIPASRVLRATGRAT